MSNVGKSSTCQEVNKFLKVTKVTAPSVVDVEIAPRPFSKKATTGIKNVDTRDKSDDPLCATEYVNDIHKYHREKESLTMVDPEYIREHPKINELFRATVVDWLVAVHSGDYGWGDLSTDTLYLTVNLIDRFLALASFPVTTKNFQLVSVACFFIASKYEDIYPPFAGELCDLSNRVFCPQDIFDMEERIMTTLDYHVSLPTANTFLLGYLKVAGASTNELVVNVAGFLLDGSLLSYALLKFLPSQLAAAVVLLACECTEDTWNSTLVEFTGYSFETIVPVAQAVLEAKMETPENLLAIDNKYKTIIDNFDPVAAHSGKFKTSGI